VGIQKVPGQSAAPIRYLAPAYERENLSLSESDGTSDAQLCCQFQDTTLYKLGGSGPEFGAGIKLAIVRGWLIDQPRSTPGDRHCRKHIRDSWYCYPVRHGR
jgi:hypothetical protein